MIDVIIPAYNAKDTIFKTLSSLAIQRDIDFNVYIVNDCSEYDYSNYVEYFSKYYKIEEITLKENLGPGGARNEGIKRTNSEYIIFIDSDDYLYAPYSLKKMFNSIKENNGDILISSFIYERDNERIIKKEDYTWLHGKVYRREFLNNNNIGFNGTRANEDNGFNRLILLLNPKIIYLDEVTYVYSENPTSITRKNNRAYKLDGLEGYIYNMKWAMEEAMKRNCDLYNIADFSITVLISMYFYYLDLYSNPNVDNILKWSKNIIDLYNSVNININEECINIRINSFKKRFASEGKYYEEIIDYNDFIKKVENYD